MFECHQEGGEDVSTHGRQIWEAAVKELREQLSAALARATAAEQRSDGLARDQSHDDDAKGATK